MASSTSLNNIVVTMALAQKYIYQIVCPIFMFAGTIGCILNLIVFTQKTLRKNPCSIYFIAYNLANFIYIYSSLLSLTLAIGYSVDASKNDINICRIRLYIIFLSNCLSPFYLIMASIDRILITSPNALTRQKSTCRLAYICVGVGTLFWALYHTVSLMSAAIVYVSPTISMCSNQQGSYLVYQGYYSLIKETLPILLMIICGLWSIRNIRKTNRVRAAPDLSMSRTTAGGGHARSSVSKDRQMALMLLLDITIYAVFSLPIGILLIYQYITQYTIKSFEQQQLETSITLICLFSVGIPFCTSFYANLIVSKTFRKEVKKALPWNRIICSH